MIEIVKETKGTKKVCEPHYLLTYNYMIGDADGDTTEKVEVSLDNPYLERFVKLMNSLQPTKGYWGICLEEGRLENHFKEGQITEDDYNFLLALLFDWETKSTFVIEPENEEYSHEFSEGVRSETEYSFLSFEGIDLQYVDEFGKKHKAVIK